VLLTKKLIVFRASLSTTLEAVSACDGMFSFAGAAGGCAHAVRVAKAAEPISRKYRHERMKISSMQGYEFAHGLSHVLRWSIGDPLCDVANTTFAARAHFSDGALATLPRLDPLCFSCPCQRALPLICSTSFPSKC
jgi:hypothetical protein